MRIVKPYILRGSLETHMPRLTEREAEIVGLIADGLTNKEIGAALGVREATIAWHVANVLSKLEVPSRSTAVAIAIGRGLLRDRGRSDRGPVRPQAPPTPGRRWHEADTPTHPHRGALRRPRSMP